MNLCSVKKMKFLFDSEMVSIQFMSQATEGKRQRCKAVKVDPSSEEELDQEELNQHIGVSFQAFASQEESYQFAAQVVQAFVTEAKQVAQAVLAFVTGINQAWLKVVQASAAEVKQVAQAVLAFVAEVNQAWLKVVQASAAKVNQAWLMVVRAFIAEVAQVSQEFIRVTKELGSCSFQVTTCLQG